MKRLSKQTRRQTLGKIIQQVEWEEVAVGFVGNYPSKRKNLEEYHRVFEALKEIKPAFTRGQIVICDVTPLAGFFPTPSERSFPTPSSNPFPSQQANPAPTPSERSFPTPSSSPFPSQQASPAPTPSERSLPTPSSSPAPRMYVVYGRKSNKDDGDTLAFTSWAEWLGRRVCFKAGFNYSNALIAAICLYEICYYGFSEAEIEKERLAQEEEMMRISEACPDDDEYDPYCASSEL